MAETENDQKTHAPTDKKLEDARKRGDIPHAPEMRQATMFVCLLVVVTALGAQTARTLASMTAGLWSQAGEQRLTTFSAPRVATAVLTGMMQAIGPLLLASIVAAVLGLLLQGRPSLSWSRLALKWDRLSPMAGAKRLLGKQALVEFGKTLIKFGVVATVLVALIWPAAAGLDAYTGADAGTIGQSAAGFVAKMVRAAALMVGVLALGDFLYQRRAWLAKMRMSLQEIKDEHKQNEGDPHIKQRIRAIAMSRAQRRMMAKVPEASVIVTNPTHYAVALKYDHGEMRAPIVVAKGVDLIALKIREIADNASIPIVESPPLARALYAGVEIDHPIPVEYYAAVAEIISYVIRLTRSKMA